ncbi:MAG: zinc ABC transporter solute-binding protein [Calditrichaeota bacterium]|nr:zinc ABC transporter solute-binding protein [Calditrichota bacterium]
MGRRRLNRTKVLRDSARVRFIAVAILCGLIVIGLIGCSRTRLERGQWQIERPVTEAHPIKIVTTTGMIADAASEVGGRWVSVKALMGPGVDPHLYKAREGDVLLLADADLILYNGLHLEGKMTDILKQLGDYIPTVAVAEAIPESLLIAPPEYEGNYDPHIWFDVRLWMRVVETIRDVLVELDPSHAADYRANASRYLQQLEELHEYVWNRAREVPERIRVLITAHDAFNYFSRAYHFPVRGLQGISTAAEAGISDVRELADFIVSRRIPAIFVETSVPPRYIEALREAVRARGFDVKIGGALYSDALGTPGTPEGTYLGMVRYNIDTIVSALLQQPLSQYGIEKQSGRASI